MLNSWLGQALSSRHALYCLPVQCSGTWLAVAVLPAGHALLANVECKTGIEPGLALLPRNERIKKQVREYRRLASQITAQWATVRQICTQAARFEQFLLANINI